MSPLSEIELMVHKHEQTLYGETGTNGLRGQFKVMDRKIDDVKQAITRAGGIFVGIQIVFGIIVTVIMLFK
jgi:hypothetical protein